MFCGQFSRRSLLAGATVALAGTSFGRALAQSDFKSPVSRLRISTFKEPNYSTGYVLEKVAPPGLTIDVISTSTNSDALDALLSGDTDMSYMGVIACSVAVGRNRPVRAVASAGSKGSRLTVRKDSGITSVKMLAGKNVGVAKSTNQDLILRELLRQAGIDPIKGVNYILLPSDTQVESLLNKTVDAVCSPEPYGSLLLKTGLVNELAPGSYDTEVGNPGVLVALSKKTIDEKPELAQFLTTLHAKATLWSKRNPDELVKTFLQITRMKEDVVRLAMDNSAIHYNIDDNYIARAQKVVEALRGANYFAGEFDVGTAFDTRFLPQAREAAGEII
ncbi:ABC transporter substrate-binding protein [Bradyrhizobium sp. dw_78]|uniref:ABC transporter substrate-binding protein n=1 Tax=Bradyrhizobium sp. dw_78 TaxID=2719793 RepID=UPI001BD47669|nr:ABC transporter substrate-binding protein [Bradyrhizobium sp. dw_78]